MNRKRQGAAYQAWSERFAAQTGKWKSCRERKVVKQLMGLTASASRTEQR